MERTYLMIKPDGVSRNLIGEIVSRFENKGFKMCAAKLMLISRAQAEEHYAEHKDKYFFEELVSFITSGPVFAMVWEGENIIKVARRMIGDKDPLNVDVGSIRGMYATTLSLNIIHGSDSVESARREIEIFFDQSELL